MTGIANVVHSRCCTLAPIIPDHWSFLLGLMGVGAQPSLESITLAIPDVWHLPKMSYHRLNMIKEKTYLIIAMP